ncbi:von Willebrand factor type A domain containing [Brachionus plicatilis]|uniref:von Willebrand factor type A domain containing n=1 Tax=Brachionus plicatilis TaxID=10195 RepID=A0A3M7RH60_BRAPC|nr:von Willebrand factor type A domain containing [Brachionus plicatilis]
MDCTGSMGSYIDNARNSIKMIVEEIVSLEKSDVKLALIEYRDNPPQDTTFETRVHDFTGSIKQMKSWLEECQAQGGGDEPECVAEALHAALKLSWRDNSTKICILISDAPPHGINCPDDSFPNGSPNEIDPIQCVIKLAEKSVTLYSIGCEPALIPYKEFFCSLAYRTGGQYIYL